jgi:glutamyl-tRNA reductase
MLKIDKIMWSDLILLHDIRSPRSKENLNGFLTWNTCQRTIRIGFSPTPSDEIHKLDLGDQYLQESALCLLIETVCGLHSRLFGEREIFTQFEDRFKESKLRHLPNQRSFFTLKKTVSDISSAIRSQVICPVLDISYGKLTLKAIPKGKSIAILGTGNLALSLLSDLVPHAKEVLVVGRNLSTLKQLQSQFNIKINSFDSFAANSEVYIIATPTISPNLISTINGRGLIIDFREDNMNSDEDLSQYISLEMLLSRYQNHPAKMEELKVQIAKRIREAVFANRHTYKSLSHLGKA